MKRQSTAVLLPLAMLLVCAAQAGTILEFDLDGTPMGRVGAKQVVAEFGTNAIVVESVDGLGIEPGPDGPALSIPVPNGLWNPVGTLAFRFRPSRTVRFRPDGKALKVTLAETPLFKLALQQHERHLVFMADMKTGNPKRRARGRVFWSHLAEGKWYHVAFAWDAQQGLMETYLNGALQQEMRIRRNKAAWTPPKKRKGALRLGGTLGAGKDEVRFAVDAVRLFDTFATEQDMAAMLEDKPNFALAGEGRWDLPGTLEIDEKRLTLVYEADFTKPLNVVHEDELFDGQKRVRTPDGKDWVLEGDAAKAWTENGRCIVETAHARQHAVLWNTHPAPEAFLLEFGMSPTNSSLGLGIIFFAAQARTGGSPFQPGLRKRVGRFGLYHSGELDCYHTSYWAADHTGVLRRSVNLRKNHGFRLPAAGIDRIGGAGPGPHRVRLLKVGGKIRLETRGKMSLAFDDDGRTYGPVLNDGWIGLRQMGHATHVEYTHFKIWKVERQP